MLKLTPLLAILIGLFLMSSCTNSSPEKKHVSADALQSPRKKIISKKTKKQITDCEAYFKKRHPDDSLRISYINEILAHHSLTKNNIAFLNALKNDKEDELAFEKVLAPIFRLSNSEIGIFAFAAIKQVEDKFVEFSKEADLIQKYTKGRNKEEYSDKLEFYPGILDSLFKHKSKPIVNYYTVNKSGSTQLKNLGEYRNECLAYFEYAIDTTNISINSKLLFSSPFKIDLVFENNPRIDALIQKGYRKECSDCPDSSEFEKTFARVKGTNNLYFVYADTFPINNKLHTPSRALVYINNNQEAVYFWHSEIDLFGCSCL